MAQKPSNVESSLNGNMRILGGMPVAAKGLAHTLILAGNPNVPAMINGLIIATRRLRADLRDQTTVFTEVHVFNSEQSIAALMTSKLDWKGQLLKHGISHTSLVHHQVSLGDTTEDRFDEVVAQLKTIVNPLQPKRYYVDVTNGVSSIKAILSVFSYVLDIENVFSVEVQFADDPEARRRQASLFYDSLSQEPGIKIEYRRLPRITAFDAFGKLNYTEILRYRRLYSDLSRAASSVDAGIDRPYLESLLLDGINSRLTGDVTGDPSHYRHAVFSFAAATEELAKVWLHSLGEAHEGKTLGQQLAAIRENLPPSALYFIDEKTLSQLTTLLNTIRNNVVHSKPQSTRPNELPRLQADLVRQLTEAFGAFVVIAVSAFLDEKGQPVRPIRLESGKIQVDAAYLFGLDGNGTGEFLERAFDSPTNSLEEVKRRSQAITETLQEIAEVVRQKTQNSDAVVFAAGDNMLFSSKYDADLIGEIQNLYAKRTGLRCSVGFGLSLREVSIALKLAKADSEGLVGIRLE